LIRAHGHLGQILTYAAGTDPATIVWVVTSFRPEHRAAIDWLNERTDEDTRSVGVEIQVVRTIPDSIAGESDPYVGVGSDGTLYVSYSDGTGHARVAISRDHGATWGKSIDVGTPAGVRNSEFAMVVAGDGNRATVAFLGTTTPGSTQAASFGKNQAGDTFVGAAWHLYMSTTYDRGKTWTTVDATPKDPIQRGCIWNSGGSNPCRNLLDFNDITIDDEGRVLVAYADGCIGACAGASGIKVQSVDAYATVAYQSAGKGLFAAFDTS